MKVLHISTGFNHGGASIACKRLVEAQREAGIDAKILTQEYGVFPDYVSSTTKNSLKKQLNFLRLAWEKFVFLFFQSSGNLRFQYSMANTGETITSHPWVKEADILHLHWINAGFLSLNEIKKLVHTGKPVVWTLHDIWPFTGGCHIAADCINYQKNCLNCYYLKNSESHLSYLMLEKKKKIYDKKNIKFIAPSTWQQKRASTSNLLKNFKIIKIHNPIRIFENLNDKIVCRKLLSLPNDKKLILFAAFNTKDKHKGISFLLRALDILSANSQEIELVIIGKKTNLLESVNFKINYLGFISDDVRVRQIYKAVDVFVTPSVEDNLPNTVLESLSVGTPVVAFKTGGIPEMIDHAKNGYLAEYKNSEQLAEGINWCLENNKEGKLSGEAIKTIQSKFSYSVIGKQFEVFYKNILNAQN